MKAKYKRLTGALICITWGMLCALLVIFQPFELITDDGPYTLIGAPAIASCMISGLITMQVDDFFVASSCHIPKHLSTIVFFVTQFIIYASIGLLVPWNKFKLSKNSTASPGPLPK